MKIEETPFERRVSDLNVNARIFVPLAAQQSQQWTTHPFNPGQLPQPHAESINGPYGFLTGSANATDSASSQRQPAISGSREWLAADSTPVFNQISHSRHRDYNFYTGNLPANVRPRSAWFRSTHQGQQQNHAADTSQSKNLYAASAHLLFIRYGTIPSDLVSSDMASSFIDNNSGALPIPLLRGSTYQSGRSSTTSPLQKPNQHDSFDVTRNDSLLKPVGKVTRIPTDPPLEPADDEDDNGDCPGEGIWTETSYLGPSVPRKYSLDEDIKVDKNDNELPWANTPLPPPFPYQQRFLPPKSSTQSRIPIYQNLGGMQYDQKTKLYYGDSAPRPTPFRTDGTGHCTPKQVRDDKFGSVSTDTRKTPHDILHIQPALEVRDNLIDFGVNGVATMRYCRCIGMWGPEHGMAEHVCTEPTIENRVQATPTNVAKARSMGWIPDREPNLRHNKRGFPQKKNVHAANAIDVTTGAGDGDTIEVKVRDFAGFSVDSRGERGFAGQIRRDCVADIQG